MNIVTRYMHKYLLAPTLDIIETGSKILLCVRAHILIKKVPYRKMQWERKGQPGLVSGDLNFTWGSYSHVHSFDLQHC
jgi:hypothetical protein